MFYRRRIWVLLTLYVFVLQISFAQDKKKPDSVEIIKTDTTNRIIDAVIDNKVSKEILKSVTRRPPKEIINIRSEEAFMPYEGKIIRQIIVNHINFERSITDTTQTVKN